MRSLVKSCLLVWGITFLIEGHASGSWGGGFQILLGAVLVAGYVNIAEEEKRGSYGA